MKQSEKKFQEKEDKKRKRCREEKKHDGNRWKQIKDHRQRLNTFLLLWQRWWWWWLGILGSLDVCHFSYGIHDKMFKRIILLLCFLLRQSLIGISLFCLGLVNWCEFWIIIYYFLMFVVIINSLSSAAHLFYSSLHGMSGFGYYIRNQNSLCKMIGVIWRKLSVNRHGTSQLLIIYYHYRHITEYLISETPQMSCPKSTIINTKAQYWEQRILEISSLSICDIIWY